MNSTRGAGRTILSRIKCRGPRQSQEAARMRVYQMALAKKDVLAHFVTAGINPACRDDGIPDLTPFLTQGSMVFSTPFL